MESVTVSPPWGGILQSRVKEAELQMKALNVLEGKENTVTALCHALSEDLQNLKNGTGHLKTTLNNQKLQIKQMKKYAAKLKDTYEHMEYIENNLPRHFTVKDAAYKATDEEMKHFQVEQRPLVVTRKTEVETHARPEGTTAKQQHKRKEPEHKCPTVTFLTQAEFDSIPIYLRSSNLKYDDIGTFVSSFNEALQNKYQLMSQPRTKIKDRELYNRYKREETHGTKGVYFVTEEDLKRSVKTHKLMQSLISILRSFQRVREIRGEGIVRYAVAQ